MRLIDGDALKEQFKDKEGSDFTAFHFYDAIDEMPTIEAPHKTGRWVRDRYCSNCDWSNEDVYFAPNWTGKYCPNCGTKMEGRRMKDAKFNYHQYAEDEEWNTRFYGGEEK